MDGWDILLGYDLDSRARKLVVNPEEAEGVRQIFRLYVEGTPVLEIVQRFDKLGRRNKQWTTQEGKPYGGSPLQRCHIYIRGMIYCSCCGSGMYSTYSANKQRRYRYYVCYRSQQKLEGHCTSRAVSATSVEDAVVESIRRVGVHPDVLTETVRLARQHLAEGIADLREELNVKNDRVKNLKSQVARFRHPEAARLVEIREKLVAGETRAQELRKEILWREKQRIEEKELRRTMESFEEVWKAMNFEEQRKFLGQLVEKVGYDGRTGKVTVSFKSSEVKELVQRWAVR